MLQLIKPTPINLFLKRTMLLVIVLFQSIWAYSTSTNYRYVAPVEVVPYPSGAGTVYIDNPAKPSVSGLIPKYQSQGSKKKWHETYGTSDPASNGDVTVRCAPSSGWFFVGWTADNNWSESNTTIISTEQSDTWTKVLKYYKTDIEYNNYPDDAPKMVEWGNKNKDKCRFYYANFARVKASTASNDGTVSCSPLVNQDGDRVTLTATVNTGSEANFAYWSRNGEQVSTDNPYTFTVSSGHYGEYVAVFSTISYPPDGTYVFKNTGTGKFASFATDVLSPNAKRDKINARKFSIEVSDEGELTSFVGDGIDIYRSRSALIDFANNVLTELGVPSPNAADFVNGATAVRLEPVTGGYKAFHQIPALTCGKTWNEIKSAALDALPSSSLSSEEKAFVELILSEVEPGGKYYLVATTDGSAIGHHTDADTDYAIWNYETRDQDYLPTVSGWARLRNKETGRYAAFVGDSYSSSENDFKGIAAMKDGVTALSDPSTIFWVRNSSSVSDLYAQGEGLRNMTNEWLIISSNDDGSVVISPAEAASYHLTDANNNYPTATYGSGSNTHWILEPLTEAASDLFSFGAKCGTKFTDGESYYTTMYTCFPYQCLDGVKAYYVKGIQGSKVVCQLISSGKVPASTPVILECKSTDPQKNRLLPLPCSYNYNDNVLKCSDNSVTALTNNLLVGVYFNLAGYTQTLYDPNKYLTFSISNDKLGFYTWSGSYLSANKAYLNLEKIPSTSAKTIDGMIFWDEDVMEQGIATGGIEKIDNQSGLFNIMSNRKEWFTLDGRKLSGHPVEKGVYIFEGRKVVIR